MRLGRLPATKRYSNLPFDDTNRLRLTIIVLDLLNTNQLQRTDAGPHPLDLDVGAIALTSDVRETAEFLHPVGGVPKPEHLQAWEREVQLQENSI